VEEALEVTTDVSGSVLGSPAAVPSDTVAGSATSAASVVAHPPLPLLGEDFELAAATLALALTKWDQIRIVLGSATVEEAFESPPALDVGAATEDLRLQHQVVQ